MDDAGLILILAIVFWAASNWVGGLIAKDRGLYNANFIVSLLFFGPFALLVLLAYKPNLDVLDKKDVQDGLKKWCVFCGEAIQVRAVKCCHCGSELSDG